MAPILDPSFVRDALARIDDDARAFARSFPGGDGRRQPVHVVYGGAHLFSRSTPAKLGELARRVFAEHAPDPETFGDALGLASDLDLRAAVHARVSAKLAREPVEDLRIDFEDGYGVRPDGEEDGAAVRAATELAALLATNDRPAFLGLRIKALDARVGARAIRTLDLFLGALAGAGATIPVGFVVTLPKVTSATQVAVLADLLDRVESDLGLSTPSVSIELMVEHPAALFDDAGALALPKLVAAARGRCVAAHLGAYDLTASFGVTAAHQTMAHPAADFARMIMLASLAGSGVRLSDGATTFLPIAKHRGADLDDAQRAENRALVHRAWRLHHDDVRRGLALGLYQGWDLHPGQLPSRYGALFAFFLEALPSARERLRAFLERAAQASRVGAVFDDAATGQGLLNFYLRGVACGALDERDVEDAGLRVDELRTRSFAEIVRGRG